MNSPAFQFYPKAWLADDNVMLMDWDARAMHLHLMCIAWQQQPPCTLPDNDEDLSRWCGSPKEWERIKKQIFRAWERRGDRWAQAGLEREYLKQKDFRESRSANARKRWDKQPQNGSNARGMHVHSKSNALQSLSLDLINKREGATAPSETTSVEFTEPDPSDLPSETDPKTKKEKSQKQIELTAANNLVWTTWNIAFEEFHGRKYFVSKPAADREWIYKLLRQGIEATEIIRVFKQAWKIRRESPGDNTTFWCGQAETVTGLAAKWNNIQSEIESYGRPKPNGHQRTAPASPVATRIAQEGQRKLLIEKTANLRAAIRDEPDAKLAQTMKNELATLTEKLKVIEEALIG